MIAFKNDINLIIVDEFDEKTDSIVHESTKLFKAGQPVEVDIIPSDHHHVDLQFGNGSIALGVFREAFTVLLP